MLGLGETHEEEEETSGDSPRSRTRVRVALTCTPAPWSRCVLTQDGESVLHCHLKAAPEPFLQAITPDRADLVVCVAWTLHLVLASCPLRPGGDSLRLGPCPLHEGHPWGQGEE
jgi:hypothetical protein